MVLSKETYMKKYIGKINSRLTTAYKKRGNTISKNNTLVKKYSNIFAIKNGNDTVGYLVDNNIHSTKTKYDRNKKSHQKWEKTGGRKSSCGCSNQNCKGNCAIHLNEEKKGGKGSCGCSNQNCKGNCATHLNEEKKGGRGCSNPNCNCGKRCGCQNKPKKGGSRKFNKNCACMEGFARQMFN
jgi:hypothetical protein